MKPDLFILALEASGDRVGAELIDSLYGMRPDLAITGIGGAEMAARGIAPPFAPVDLAIVGYLEALKALPRVRRALRLYLDHVLALRTKAAVLIDSWGFTIRIAKELRRRAPEIRLIKYIGPQVWATRAGRAHKLAAVFDHLLAVSALETPFYAGLPMDFTLVGHPVLGRSRPGDDAGFRTRQGISPDAPLLVVLPGSRLAEIDRLAPVFARAASLLTAQIPDLRVLALAARGMEDRLGARFSEAGADIPLVTDEGAKADLLRAGNAGLACSGTVVAESMLQDLPVVAAYRVDWPTYQLARHVLYKEKYITLANIAVDAPVITERIQHECRPEILAADLFPLLTRPEMADRQRQAQREALAMMGLEGPPAHERAAKAILSDLGKMQERAQ